MAKKKKVPVITGEQVVSTLSANDSTAAYEVMGEVSRGFTAAFSAFSSTGPVGSALTSVAPAIVLDPSMILPPLKQLGPAEMAASKRKMLEVLFDPKFTDALGNFQTDFVVSTLEEQVGTLKHFTEIDWDFLTRSGSAPSGMIDKFRHSIYFRQQMTEVRSAELEEIMVLVKIPQFVQLLNLASAYGKMMLAAYSSFEKERVFLNRIDENNVKITAELEKILAKFEEAEDRRLRSLADIETTTAQLQKAIDVTELLAELENRTQEMVNRVQLDKTLVGLMQENSEQTVSAQLALLEEMSRSLHTLASNQSRESRVGKAVRSLNLYVKCYTVFELILTMLQVYLLAASSAVQTVLANKIQTEGSTFGREYYLQNVAPLQQVTDGYVRRFAERNQVLVDADSVPA
jgi:hypothetical protein